MGIQELGVIHCNKYYKANFSKALIPSSTGSASIRPSGHLSTVLRLPLSRFPIKYCLICQNLFVNSPQIVSQLQLETPQTIQIQIPHPFSPYFIDTLYLGEWLVFIFLQTDSPAFLLHKFPGTIINLPVPTAPVESSLPLQFRKPFKIFHFVGRAPFQSQSKISLPASFFEWL